MIIDQTIYETRFQITRSGSSSLYICLSYTDWWTDVLFYVFFRPGFPISKFTPTLHLWLRPLQWVAVDSGTVSAVSSFDCSHGNKLILSIDGGASTQFVWYECIVIPCVVWISPLTGTHTATTRGQDQPLWPITSTEWLPWKLSYMRINLALFSRSANVFVSNQLKKHLIFINITNTPLNYLYKQGQILSNCKQKYLCFSLLSFSSLSIVLSW